MLQHFGRPLCSILLWSSGLVLSIYQFDLQAPNVQNMHRIRWKDRLDRQIDILLDIAQCYPMIQPFAMQVELQYMQSGEMYCIYLPKHAITCPNYFQVTSSSKISKPAGAHLDTWAVDRPWVLGTCLQGCGDGGWTIEPWLTLEAMPCWLSYFWKDHPIISHQWWFSKKSVTFCSHSLMDIPYLYQ